MDYDSLSQGRRRNWEALKPAEVRRREKLEAHRRRQEEKRQKGEQETLFTRRDRIRREATQREKAEYRRAVRQATALGLAFVGAILLLIGLERLWAWQHQRFWAAQLAEVNLIEDGRSLMSRRDDPVGALALWRHGWEIGDMATVVGLHSDRYMKRHAAGDSRARMAQERQSMYDRGILAEQRTMAMAFDLPEILQVPRKPWADGELALFRSSTIHRRGDDPAGSRFIAAFAYDEREKEWRFADVREAQHFSVRWEHESYIKPLARGRNEIRYDEDGYPIEEEEGAASW